MPTNTRPVVGPGGRALPERDDDRRDERNGREDADDAAGRNEDFQHDERAADQQQEDGPGYVGDDHTLS